MKKKSPIGRHSLAQQVLAGFKPASRELLFVRTGDVGSHLDDQQREHRFWNRRGPRHLCQCRLRRQASSAWQGKERDDSSLRHADDLMMETFALSKGAECQADEEGTG